MPSEIEGAGGRDPALGTSMILLIDNYDSFVYNLAHLLEKQGAVVEVVRNDMITADAAEALPLTHLVISPGPGRPSDAGNAMEIFHRLAKSVPVLGVCLGHQIIVEGLGGRVGASKQLVHGKSSMVKHDAKGLFEGLPCPLRAGRYHSLAAVAIPEVLEVCGMGDDEVMAVRHRDLPIHGVQFHPESILTPDGEALVRNFLEHP
jgi:anthranilate synthase/aminodeoxychorismate synthase-like glutamine amidotransferase